MTYDKDRLRECLFDEETAPALAALEDGPKDISHLAEQCGMSEDDTRQRLSYLVEHGFLAVRDGTYEADAEKLAGILEDEDYSGIVDSVTVMDSYLN
ncbi:MAG: hypothetical protein J4G04_04000 [Nitrosopumilaceae archaeon]|nr:hypothetical protein [Nitrosopumilaceae archaeon]